MEIAYGNSRIEKICTDAKRAKKELGQVGAKTNDLVLMPPGNVLREKIFELGLDATELARRCKLPLETMPRPVCVPLPTNQGVHTNIAGSKHSIHSPQY